MNKSREGSSNPEWNEGKGAGAPFPYDIIWPCGALDELEDEVRLVLGYLGHARAARDAGRYPCEAGCGSCQQAGEYGFGLEET